MFSYYNFNNRGKHTYMNKESIIEVLEDFIDYLKEKEDRVNEEVNEDIVPEDDGSDDFDKVIDKIAKGE